MATPAIATQPTLAAASREAARERIISAAMVALAEHGMDATIDEVAVLAGISRRTVFRYFATHGQLMTAAYDAIWRRYQDHIPGPPDPGEDVRTWLKATVVTIHGLNAQLGAAWWSLHAPQVSRSEELETWRRGWLNSRPEVAVNFTASAWRAVGGKGRPPKWVVETFFLQMSGFVSSALLVEGPRTPEEIGELTSQILWAVLVSAAAESRGGKGVAGTRV